MTGEWGLLAQLEKAQGGCVTFSDENTTKILGVGTIVAHGIPPLPEALYMKGLKQSLVSISQLCDKGYTLQFGKDECIIKNHEGGRILVEGMRTRDNCYVIEPYK